MTIADTDLRALLLDAALPHVAFDGWSETTFSAAIRDIGADAAAARAACPRGAVDLAVAYHERGDRAMVDRLSTEDLSGLRFRDRVAAAVRYRIEAIPDKEASRRGVTLFSLPLHAALGAKLIWGTADAIWTALGDTSEDYNWYTKRATLAGVYGSVVLYWLGDSSPDNRGTWAFIDRRIDDVMQIEKLKANVRKAPLIGPLARGAEQMLSRVKPPLRRTDLPGFWHRPQAGK